MKHRRSGEASQRQLRVGELIRHALAELLQRGDIHDPGFDGATVTISEVRLTPDLKTATAFFMPLGGREVDGIAAAFERNRGVIRREVARRVNLRYAPDITFRPDPSFDEGDRIDALLRSPSVARDLDEPDPEAR